MPDLRRPGWRNTSVDDQIFQGEGWLFAVAGNVTAAGLCATLYDAHSAVAERKIFSLRVPANETHRVTFWPPLPIAQGVYVDMDSNGTELLVEYLADPGWSSWADWMATPKPQT